MSRRRKRKSRINIPKVIKTVGLLSVAFYVCATLANQQIKIADNKHLIYETEREVAAVIQETISLNEELLHVDDDDYLEHVAREKLGLVKPNERIFIDANRVR